MCSILFGCYNGAFWFLDLIRTSYQILAPNANSSSCWTRFTFRLSKTSRHLWYGDDTFSSVALQKVELLNIKYRGTQPKIVLVFVSWQQCVFLSWVVLWSVHGANIISIINRHIIAISLIIVSLLIQTCSLATLPISNDLPELSSLEQPRPIIGILWTLKHSNCYRVEYNDDPKVNKYSIFNPKTLQLKTPHTVQSIEDK